MNQNEAFDMELSFLQKVSADILHVDPREVTEDSDFLEDLGADSLDLFQIVSQAEEQYEIKIREEDCRSMRTVGDLIRIIKRKTKR